MRLGVVCALSFLFLNLGACIGRAQDAHEPGDRLGTYHLDGKLVSDSCQAAVLGVTSNWQFDVKLSREGSTLYWINGEEAIPGDIQSDGKQFGFSSGVEVTLQAPKGVQPGCVVLRGDSASGKLSSKTTDVKSLDVDLDFTYSVKPGTQCAGYVGVQDGFAGLPCKVSYSMAGTRTALPPSLQE